MLVLFGDDMLNDEQREAVTNSDSFIFLLAGAGTGKTRVLIERIKYLIASGVPEEKILAITFTNKASLEMKERLGNDQITVSTFHKFYYDELNISSTSKKIVSNYPGFTKEELLKITKYKKKATKFKPFIYHKYEKYLSGNLDFDDLELMYMNTEKKKNFQHVLIDEFQDINDVQYKIIKQLVGNKTNVFAVGDPDQSIYSFRGANVKIINQYVKDFVATMLPLKTNYRSAANIIKIANHFISHNVGRIKKELHSTFCINENIAYFIGERNINVVINQLVSNGVKRRNIAILGRNNNDIERYKSVSGVQMMTIHKSKGLEFDAVIIVGMNKYSFPGSIDNTRIELEEERRLMFVAITRAKRYLCLVNDEGPPSRFIKESCGKKWYNKMNMKK